MADSIVQIIMRAKDEASQGIQRVEKHLEDAQKKTEGLAGSMQTRLTLGASLAKAAMTSLAGAVLALSSNAIRIGIEIDTAASSIAGMAGLTSAAIPKIREQIASLAKKNDNPIDDLRDAVMQLYTTWKIFDVDDDTGLAQMLITWKDVTGQNFQEAAESFRGIVLTYFGPDADLTEVLPSVADKIFAVATAVGVDPGGLAAALAKGGPIYKTVFGDMDAALRFLASVGGAAGDITQASQAILQFIQRVQDMRSAWEKGEPPPEATADAFAALGLAPETVQNEAADIGTLIMTAIKNAMMDGELSVEEINALGVLFGPEFGTSLATAAGSVEDFSARADAALSDFGGSLDAAGEAADNTFAGRLTEFFRSFKDFGGIDWTRVVDGIKNILGALTDFNNADLIDDEAITQWFKDLGAGIVRLATEQGANLAAAGAAIWGAVVRSLTEAAGSVGGAGEVIWSSIRDAAVNVAGDLSDVGTTIWNAVKTAWDNAVTGAQGAAAFLSDLWTNHIRPAFKPWTDGLATLGTNLWAGLRDAATTAIQGAEGIAAWATNRWLDLQEAFDGWIRNIYTVGQNMIAGFIQGLQSAWSDVKTWVDKRTDEFIGWWKDRLGIHSPSTVFAEAGAFLIEGLKQGLDRAMPGLRTQVESIVNEVTSAVDGMVASVNNLAASGWTDGWGKMASVVTDSLKKINDQSQLFSDTDLSTWSTYFTTFAGLLDKHKGNVLAAMGEMIIGIIQQKLVEVAVVSATEVAKAAIMAPASFGATLAMEAPILIAAAAGAAALEALKSQLIPSYAVGSTFIPTDQMAQLHAGEMVIPRTFAEGIRQGDVSLGGGPTIVQVWLDGRMVAEQVGNRLYDGVRRIVRADLPALT